MFITFFAQKQGGAIAPTDVIPFAVRIENALVSYVQYIVKMIYPVNLAVLYPHPGAFPLWKVVGGATLILMVSYAALRKIKKYPFFLVGWLWYLGTLVPIIGIVQVGAQSMADRYTYIPLIGIFIILAWGVPQLTERWPYKKKAAAARRCRCSPSLHCRCLLTGKNLEK